MLIHKALFAVVALCALLCSIAIAQNEEKQTPNFPLVAALDAAGYTRIDSTKPPMFEPFKANQLVFENDVMTLKPVDPTEVIYWQTPDGIILCASLYEPSLGLPNMLSAIIHTIQIGEVNDYSNAMADILNASIYTGRFVVEPNNRMVLWTLYNPVPEYVKEWLEEIKKISKLAIDSAIALAFVVSDEKLRASRKIDETYVKTLNDSIEDRATDLSKQQLGTLAERQAQQMQEYLLRIEQYTGGTVYIDDNSDRFHTKGCKYLSAFGVPVKLQSAIESRYTPCSLCLR